MKNTYLCMLAVVLLSVSCKKDTSTAESEISDKEVSTQKNVIKILSVVADRELVDGDTAVFAVAGEYSLVTKDSAQVLLGFNNFDSPIYNTLLPGVSKLVTKGSGTFKFTVSAVVKNWGTSANFVCYVNLSPYPESKGAWTPYANDTYTLLPKVQ
jgi:hypothetical protein